DTALAIEVHGRVPGACDAVLRRETVDRHHRHPRIPRRPTAEQLRGNVRAVDFTAGALIARFARGSRHVAVAVPAARVLLRPDEIEQVVLIAGNARDIVRVALPRQLEQVAEARAVLTEDRRIRPVFVLVVAV